MATDPYPGNAASPKQLLQMAVAYHEAAKTLLPSGKKGNHHSRAPWRLVAIHAVELYLNALLLYFGQTAAEIRGLQHDMGSRAERAITKGLVLRKRTASHLATIGTNREYLMVRYSPEPTATLSQITRLNATLEELSEKITKLIGG